MTAMSNTDVDYWEEFAIGATVDQPGMRLHLTLVGRRAAANAKAYGLSDRECALVQSAGLLHDIGKTTPHRRSDFHALDAAAIAEEHGAGELAVLCAHHTGSRYEAVFAGVEIPYPYEPSSLHDALMLADLTVTPSGQVLTLQERKDDVEARYPHDGPVVLALNQMWPEVLEADKRLQHRLAESDEAVPVVPKALFDEAIGLMKGVDHVLYKRMGRYPADAVPVKAFRDFLDALEADGVE